MLNVSEMAGNSGIAGKTAEDYLFILENTYIIKRIFPFYNRLNTELTKMPKLFFEDCGVQNILENRNGQLTPQIAKDFFVEFLLRKRNLDPFQISAQIGLEQDYIIGIKRKLAKK